MRRDTAFLDASVLYPAPLRDLLLELLPSVVSTEARRAEWRDLLSTTWQLVVKTRSLHFASLRAAPVGTTDRVPDPGDRHVLAAAIKGQADIIVTSNLKDFPANALERWGIEAQHPDEFLTRQFHLLPPVFLDAVKTVRLRLRNPPKSVAEYLDTLRAQGLLATVDEIAPFGQFI